jgi:branched-chain amino acid transport system ATP-binding protein
VAPTPPGIGERDVGLVADCQCHGPGESSGAMTLPVLEVRGVEVAYDSKVVLRDTWLSVCAGEIVAIIGPNGAGKTTLLRTISGFGSMESGNIRRGELIFNGEEISHKGPVWRTRHGLVVVPSRDNVFRSLTVAENLSLAERGGSKGREQSRVVKINKAEVLEFLPDLVPHLKDKAGYLSGGERQMLAIARGLMLRPSLLLLDEITLGVVPFVVHKIMERLKQINQLTGLTMLMAEQNVAAALQVAGRVIVVDLGRIVANDTPQALMESSSVRERYFP